jgi:hypothetical protein
MIQTGEKMGREQGDGSWELGAGGWGLEAGG